MFRKNKYKLDYLIILISLFFIINFTFKKNKQLSINFQTFQNSTKEAKEKLVDEVALEIEYENQF